MVSDAATDAIHTNDQGSVSGFDADDDDSPTPIDDIHESGRLSEHGLGEETVDMANNARRINVITTFCQYIKANLNRMTDEQIDRVIEDMTVMLFRRKRAFRRSCDARF